MGAACSHIHWADGQYRNPILKSKLISADVSGTKLPGETGSANPSEKPAGFFEALLVAHTDPTEVVLDVFGGVGGMIGAAVKHLRDVVIVEKDPVQYDLYDGVLLNAFDDMKAQLTSCWKLPKGAVSQALPFKSDIKTKPPFVATDLVLSKHTAVKSAFDTLTVQT